MALQDLTPQLRTRLSRVERAVGIFVSVATLLMIGGFAFYIYHTAERKGWFKTKIKYSTSLNNAAGLNVGDPVTLMGFKVGELTAVEANGPWDYYGVTVYFWVMQPYYGYIWLDSKVRVAPADFLGNRSLEIIKGSSGEPTVLETTNGVALSVLDSDRVKVVKGKIYQRLLTEAKADNPTYNQHALKMEADLRITNEVNRAVREKRGDFSVDIKGTNSYWIEPLESPALTERLETMVSQFEKGLPGILDLTNKVSGTLNSATTATTNLNDVLTLLKPTLTNVAAITQNLTNTQGSLGDWLLPTNVNEEIKVTLDSLQATLDKANQTLEGADATIAHQDTNLTGLISNLNLTIIDLANITSNLNQQVQRNTNIVKEVSDLIVDTDDMVQGLKRHWFLRSAFKTNKTEKVEKPKSKKSTQPLTTPRNTK